MFLRDLHSRPVPGLSEASTHTTMPSGRNNGGGGGGTVVAADADCIRDLRQLLRDAPAAAAAAALQRPALVASLYRMASRRHGITVPPSPSPGSGSLSHTHAARGTRPAALALALQSEKDGLKRRLADSRARLAKSEANLHTALRLAEAATPGPVVASATTSTHTVPQTPVKGGHADGGAPPSVTVLPLPQQKGSTILGLVPVAFMALCAVFVAVLLRLGYWSNTPVFS